MSWLKNLFSKPDIKGYLDQDALILDVRSRAEFSNGHCKDAKNIPLDQIQKEIPKILKSKRPIITCCRSGARSGNAARMLKSAGVDVINGGPWQNVKRYQD